MSSGGQAGAGTSGRGSGGAEEMEGAAQWGRSGPRAEGGSMGLLSWDAPRKTPSPELDWKGSLPVTKLSPTQTA